MYPEKQDEIGVLGREVAIGREIPEFVVRARRKTEAQPVQRGAARRRGAKPAGRARFAAGDKPVPVLPTRFEAAAFRMHRMRKTRLGFFRAAPHDLLHKRVGGDRPIDRHGGWRHAAGPLRIW